MNKTLRRVVSIVLLIAALSFGVYYLIKHRSLLTQLAHTPVWVIIVVLLLYVVMLGVLLVVLDANLRLCSTKIKNQENFLLNAYTLLINFFIPGQNGPVYRGYYLKRCYGLKVRNYIAITLLYYLIYGIISLMLISLGSQPWWYTLPLGILMIVAGIVLARLYARRSKFHIAEFNFGLKNIAYLVLAVILQAIIQIIIYAVELHGSSRAHIALHQVITYTGAADLALFVALTPGAIGIREAFLVFTEHLHHISSGHILVANVIDRSVYLVFLLIILVVTLSLHARQKLSDKKSQTN
ncbi:MAG: lysylphosphatidylglycerol synthase domain-containing protein [Candidatus Saccharimonadales bacterium]